MRKKHGLTPSHFSKIRQYRRKDRLTILHFFENGPKMKKKHGKKHNPFTFFRKWVKNEKKHGLTPLHFFENGLTPLHFFENGSKMGKTMD